MLTTEHLQAELQHSGGVSITLTAEHLALMFNSPPEDSKIDIASSTILSKKNFLIWRLIITLYFWYLCFACYIVFSYRTGFYLTIWTLEFCTLYISASLYCSYLYYASQNDKCIKVCRFARVLQVIALTVSVSVVIVFWSVWGSSINPGGPLALPVQNHGVSAAFTLFDYYLCYSTLSFRKTWYYLVVFGVVYGLWSLGYTLVTDHALYTILEWNVSPIASIISVVGVITVFIIIHAIFCWTKSLLVNWLKSKLSVEEDTKKEMEIATVAVDTTENVPKTVDSPSAVSEPSITPPPETHPEIH